MEGLELLRAVRKQITEHPEAHYQGEWGIELSCGTAHCVAGWALALNKIPMHWVARDSETYRVAVELEDGRGMDVAAGKLLGLEAWEANRIFYALEEGEALAMLDEVIERREAEAHRSDQA